MKTQYRLIYLILIFLSSGFLSLSYTIAQTEISKSPYYNVMEFGATANGEIKDTKAIQNTINQCHKKGGWNC